MKKSAYDAQTLAVAQASKGLGFPVAKEYEPYYVWTVTKTDQQQQDTSRVLSSRDYRKELDIVKNTMTQSQQRPPGREK